MASWPDVSRQRIRGNGNLQILGEGIRKLAQVYVPDEALSLAMEAAKAWAELVNVLKAQRTVADLRKAAA